MGHKYYIVYSFQSSKGAGFGRTSVAREGPIQTFKDIEGVEKAVLEVCRETEPSVCNLFLTNWTELQS